MRRKIILSLLSLFLFSAAGAVLATLYIKNTTATLSKLIQLHQIEDLRQHLIISIQTAQSDLYTVRTMLGHKVDTITENVTNLEEASQKCSACHHTPEVSRRLADIQLQIQDYQNALSYYITASANRERIDKLKFDAAEIGNRLLTTTEEMSVQASQKLELMTNSAMKKINKAQAILYLTMVVTFFLSILVAIHLTKSISHPVTTLVDAARKIASGSLGYTISHKDKTEFGELASSFNSMSAALKEGYAKLEEEIFERMQTEAALVKSESFLNTIFDSIRDPFCIFDKSYQIVRANEAYAKMKDREMGGLVGKTCFETLQHRDTVCGACVVQKTFLSGDACAKEKLITTPDGMNTWLAIYTYPILDGEGNISHVIEYIRDITERKRAEGALRESEERYALAARGANDGLWDWDLRQNKVYFSYRWKSMLGYVEKEVGDNPEEWFSRIHPDDRGQTEAKIAAHIRGRNPHFESEHRILHRDGKYRWVLSRGLAVRDKDGKAYRMTGSQTDITARKTAEEQLVHDAFHDALTGLPNRALFMDRLQHAIETSGRRPDSVYAVLFLDIDRFKVINDSLGHSVGDLLLIEVGHRLSTCVRPGDTVARFGGDEFAVLLENITDASDAADVTERIQQILAPSFFIHGHEVFTSQSIGIAMKSDRYKGPEQVIRDADIAMYQAKAKGKARYEFFDSRMHASIVQRLELEADLRHAVEHKSGFLMHYQPILDLKNHKLIGFESLVRWNHPVRGIIYPLEFIPLAEETGMIFPIGDWTFRESCRQLRTWQRQYPANPPLKMSLNVSGKQFLQPAFADKLTKIIEETGVDADCLAIEITESMIMADTETAVATMTQLKDMGVHIHIDDFGTGYSSLSYLHHFPVNALKIDRSFVSKMVTNEENKEIIRTIISLAQNLALDVIAEGVELTDQLSEIKNLKCRYGQGFLFARPLAPDAVDAWIKAEKVLNG